MDRLQIVLAEVAKATGEGPKHAQNAVLHSCLEQLEEALLCVEQLIIKWKKSSAVGRVMKSTRFKQKYAFHMARLQQALTMLNGANLNLSRQTKEEVEKVGKQLTSLDITLDQKLEEQYDKIEDMIESKLGPDAILGALRASGLATDAEKMAQERQDLEEMMVEAKMQREQMEANILDKMMEVLQLHDARLASGKLDDGSVDLAAFAAANITVDKKHPTENQKLMTRRKLEANGVTAILTDLGLDDCAEDLVVAAFALGASSLRDFAEEVDEDALVAQGLKKIPAKRFLRQAKIRAGLEIATASDTKDLAHLYSLPGEHRHGSIQITVVTTESLQVHVASSSGFDTALPTCAAGSAGCPTFHVAKSMPMASIQREIQNHCGVLPSLQRLWFMREVAGAWWMDRALTKADLTLTAGTLASKMNPPGSLTIFLELTEGYVNFTADENQKLIVLKTFDPDIAAREGDANGIRLVRAVGVAPNTPVQSLMHLIAAYIPESRFSPVMPMYGLMSYGCDYPGAPGGGGGGGGGGRDNSKDIQVFHEKRIGTHPQDTRIVPIDLRVSIEQARIESGDAIIFQPVRKNTQRGKWWSPRESSWTPAEERISIVTLVF